MGLLPAAVPDVPEARSEIVPARLARKLAPLFGVPWEQGPFGRRTWVCDYNKITLSEIARGAPSPQRGRVAQARADVPSGWEVLDRVAVAGPGGLPNEIANATLNRFGPDTKAAVVLTGANRLLDPVADAVRVALRLLVAADGSPLPARLRLAAWASLLLEAFRSQPALVAAAIRARTIQRELLVEWHLPLASSIGSLPLTRCEVGSPQRHGGSAARSRPQDLELADSTIGWVTGFAPDVVDRLLHQLMEIGVHQSSSHLWLSERGPGQLVVEALVSPTELVDRFCRQVAAPGDDHVDLLPRIPDPCEMAGLPVIARRATILSLLTVLRQIQFDAEQRERTRVPIVPLLDALDALATAALGPDDPMSVLCRCRVADMTVHTLRHDMRHDLSAAVENLMVQVERCIALCADGTLDRGATAEAISSANVEINVVRRTNAQNSESKLPAPGELDAWLRGTWTAFASVVEVDVSPPADPSMPDPRLAVGHHLHNYAAYLATHPDDEADLTAAVELFENVVIPARGRYHRITHSFLPLRQSLQTASRATTLLSRRTGDPEQARRWAAGGLAWIRHALDDHETTQLLVGATEPAAHFCLLAVPALLGAVETGVPGTGPAELDRAAALLDVAAAWARRVTAGEEANYSRHAELVDLRARLDSVSSRRV